MYIAACFQATTGSCLWGFVIPCWTLSRGWPGAGRAEMSGGGAGSGAGHCWQLISIMGMVEAPSWVLPGGSAGKSKPMHPELLCESAVWAGGCSRGQREEGQITSEGPRGALCTCMGIFYPLNLITPVLGYKSFHWDPGLTRSWTHMVRGDGLRANVLHLQSPQLWFARGGDNIFYVKKHTQELYHKGEIRTANLMT